MPLFGPKSTPSERRKHFANVKAPASVVGEALGGGVQLDPNSKWHQGIQVMKVDQYGAMAKRYLTITKDKSAIYCTHQKLEKFLKTGDNTSIAHNLSKMAKGMITMGESGG